MRIVRIKAVMLSAMISLAPLGFPSLAGESDKDEAVDEELVTEITRASSSYEKLPEGRHQPWRLVRAMQRLQDEIAAGKPRGLEAYRILLTRAHRWMVGLDDSVWDYERNLDALAVYLLIGGNTEIGYKALKTTTLEDWQKLTLEAAIAYAERDAVTAHDRMLLIDLSALPPSIAPQFALAKSMVTSSTDLKMAETYLKQARRMAPGTLIEEAALRRAIRIAGESGSFKDFRTLSSSYIHRYRRSHYFGDFLKNFSFALVRMPKDKEEESLELLGELMDVSGTREQLSVSAYVARQAVITGRHKLAFKAADAALTKAKPGSQFHTRMKLYAAATTIVNVEQSKNSLRTLESMNTENFDKSDLKIHDAALSVGRQILKSNDPEYSDATASEVIDDLGAERYSFASSKQPDVSSNKTITRAEALISEASKFQSEGY